MIINPGQMVTMSVNFNASPSAEIIWTWNSNTLSPRDRISIQQEEHLTEINLTGAQTSDAGTYELKLSNSYGYVKTSCYVYVEGNLAFQYLLYFDVIVNRAPDQSCKKAIKRIYFAYDKDRICQTKKKTLLSSRLV